MIKKILRISWIFFLVVTALPVFANGQKEEAKEVKTTDVKEDVILHWRTRPDNQEEIAVYQSIR